MKMQAFQYIVQCLLKEIEKYQIDAQYVLPDFKGWDLGKLKEWWECASNAFRDNKNLLCLTKLLYEVWRIILVLESEPFTPEDYNFVRSAIHCYLKDNFNSEFPEMMRNLYEKIEKGIESSISLENISKWLEIITKVKAEIGKEKAFLLIKLIESRVYFLCKEGIKNNPRSILEFLMRSEIADQIDVNDLMQVTNLMRYLMHSASPKKRDLVYQLVTLWEIILFKRRIIWVSIIMWWATSSTACLTDEFAIAFVRSASTRARPKSHLSGCA
ncbi:unnamed protein product [Blepharisma stoltei]|uniref:Uncharacterized protein n=1 Tax=Blepharisma stoltei TaxID=1481888 RepID=A0AAU9JV07_9CILI|nr:unnamed protein product [Blepharisma stoltei]